MTATEVTQLETVQPRQPGPVRPGAAWFAVVGFDGSAPARAALDAATELIRGRNGHLQVVYVAHLSAGVAMSAPALLGVRAGFDAIAGELVDTVRAELDDREPRWHFARRDGSVADELVAAARQLRRQNGPDSIVVIVVGSAAHLRHHLVGSTAATLTHEQEFPLLVVPANPVPSTPLARLDETTAEREAAPSAPDRDVFVQRQGAERLLGRIGLSKDDIAEVLGPITFPAPLSVVTRRGEQFGFSQGSLMERLGVSP